MRFSELFNGTYTKTDEKGIYKNIVKPQNFIKFNFEEELWGISVYSGNISGYVFLTSESKNNFDIYKLKDQNFNWLITVTPSGSNFNNYSIEGDNFISNDKLNIKYDEIHVKSSKIIDSIIQFFPKKPMDDIYKDNYAKTCGKFRKELSPIGKFCGYSNLILPKQNNNGIVDASYNYSTTQYLSRPNFMKCNDVYKRNNPRFSTQGAVSGGSRINRLRYQTLVKSQQKIKTQNFNRYEFKFKVGFWEPTTQLKLYGYGNGTGTPGSLIPDTVEGNKIITLNLTYNSFLETYGLQIYFSKKIELQLNKEQLSTFKFIFYFNNIIIKIPFSDLTQFYDYGVNVEYDFDYKDTQTNYNLIKTIIDNGNIVGETINFLIYYNNQIFVTNKVNGVYPTTIYRNTYPIYKQNLSGLIKNC